MTISLLDGIGKKKDVHELTRAELVAALGYLKIRDGIDRGNISLVPKIVRWFEDKQRFFARVLSQVGIGLNDEQRIRLVSLLVGGRVKGSEAKGLANAAAYLRRKIPYRPRFIFYLC